MQFHAGRAPSLSGRRPPRGALQGVTKTDSEYYGGSNVGNAGTIEAENNAAHGYGASLSLTLPPLGVVVLQPAGGLS